ncbi:TPA: DUF3265 domain-containing protein, partial [Vibrio vulnificus]|nr:DUF3265 domain-containing protein [Vibrio vulnificus]
MFLGIEPTTYITSNLRGIHNARHFCFY